MTCPKCSLKLTKVIEKDYLTRCTALACSCGFRSYEGSTLVPYGWEETFGAKNIAPLTKLVLRQLARLDSKRQRRPFKCRATVQKVSKKPLRDSLSCSEL